MLRVHRASATRVFKGTLTDLNTDVGMSGYQYVTNAGAIILIYVLPIPVYNTGSFVCSVAPFLFFKYSSASKIVSGGAHPSV